MTFSRDSRLAPAEQAMACDYCHAQPGQACHTAEGKLAAVHTARMRAWLEDVFSPPGDR